MMREIEIQYTVRQKAVVPNDIGLDVLDQLVDEMTDTIRAQYRGHDTKVDVEFHDWSIVGGYPATREGA